MTDQTSERDPLLPGRASRRKTQGLTTLWAPLVERWPVYRVLFVAMLMYVADTGTYPVMVELSRALACAEYYQRFPSSSPSLEVRMSDNDNNNMCDKDWIEARSAQALSLIEVSTNLFAFLAVLLVQHRIATWGVKRIFCVSMSGGILYRTTALFLPLGYPYGEPVDQMTLSPIWIRRIFLLTGCLGNIFGGQMIGVMCIRMIIARISSAGDRTKNLVGLQLMNLVSLAVGPALTVWLGSLFPFSSRGMDHWALSFSRYVGEKWKGAYHHNSSSSLPAPPVPAVEPTNVAPILVSLIIVLLLLVSAFALLPKDEAMGEVDESRQAAQGDCQRSNKTKPESIFYRVWPRRDVDGKRDWRILKVVITAMAHLGSAYSLNLYIQFVGHALRWGQEAVAVLISALGTSRILVILVLVPFWTAYFQRTIPKPSLLRGLSLERIKAIAKSAPADEPPLDSAFQEEEGEDEQHVLRGAVSSWQARVDREILRISYGFDIIGWLMTAIFTVAGNAPMIIVSTLFLSLGGASLPVRMGVDLVIVGDVLARTAEWQHKHDNRNDDDDDDDDDDSLRPDDQDRPIDVHASQLYFSLLGFFENVATTASPLLLTWVYNNSLSTIPAINWFIPALLYIIAFTMHFSMPLHTHSPPVHQ